MGMEDFSVLPFGPIEDPVRHLVLSTTWPKLSEHLVTETETYSDLDPIQVRQSVFLMKVRPPSLVKSHMEFLCHAFIPCLCLGGVYFTHLGLSGPHAEHQNKHRNPRNKAVFVCSRSKVAH